MAIFHVTNIYKATNEEFINSFDSSFVVVSTASPEMEDYKIPDNKNCKGVLYLRFHDVTIDGDVNSIRPVDKNNIKPINKNDVNQLLDFVEKHKEESQWLVHCEAGLSRSPGIALALSEILNGRRADHSPYVYSYYSLQFANSIVRKKILEGYYERNGKN